MRKKRFTPKVLKIDPTQAKKVIKVKIIIRTFNKIIIIYRCLMSASVVFFTTDFPLIKHGTSLELEK